MLVAHWHPLESEAAGLEAHLHGRNLRVIPDPARHAWRWRVASEHGETLAEGVAPDRSAAERAAEDEATAVHPPTTRLIERLLS
jgi:hypothetical protein